MFALTTQACPYPCETTYVDGDSLRYSRFCGNTDICPPVVTSLVEQTTISARIPGQLYAALEVTSEDEGAFRSEVIRRALRYYMDENPDGLASLEQGHGACLSKHGPNQSRSAERPFASYNPLKEL